ncbi:MAG: type III-B CRISPR module RAMP protein Cmr6 [Desulfobacterales bacterium]
MIAIRDHLDRLVTVDFTNCENLGLRLDKLNRYIDKNSSHTHKENMLKVMSGYRISESLKESYGYAFDQWKSIMEKQEDCEFFDIISTTKILLGTGNASVHEFGVNLNRPWGVPYISGSTLKGVVSSYLAKHGGESWQKSTANTTKSDFQVELFGGVRVNEEKAYAGTVVFNDAWIYLDPNGNWFTDDIINVHHQKYYGENRLPDGTENPIPVKIAALNPNIKFFITLQGEKKERQFIKSVLIKALVEEGIGGKTSVGYGRFEVLKSVEDQNKDLIKRIAEASEEDLFQLNKEKGNVAALSVAFMAAVNDKPLSKELLPLYQKFSPLKCILLGIEEGAIKSTEDLDRIYKSLKDNLKKFVKTNPDIRLPKTVDAQKIFDYAINKLALTTNQIENNRLLKLIAYNWEDIMITENNIDEILKTRSTRKWPPVNGLKKAIEVAALPDDLKELALSELE